MERGAFVFVCYTRNLLEKESDLEQKLEVKQRRIGVAWRSSRGAARASRHRGSPSGEKSSTVLSTL